MRSYHRGAWHLDVLSSRVAAAQRQNHPKPSHTTPPHSLPPRRFPPLTTRLIHHHTHTHNPPTHTFPSLSALDLVVFTATANASIVSLNLSLMENSVGFYQAR